MKRICWVASNEATVKSHLLGHLKALAGRYHIVLVTTVTDPLFLKSEGLEVEVVSMPLERGMSWLQDLWILFRLRKLLLAREFAAIHSISPKAGLLAMMAGSWARVPVRIHTFTGITWASHTGIVRLLLSIRDRLITRSATLLLADGFSLRDLLTEEGLVEEREVTVLGDGSIGGVELERFKPSAEARAEIRQELGISGSAVVFLYVGRLSYVRGLIDPAQAFEVACRQGSDFHFILIGPDDESMTSRIRALCRGYEARVHFVEFTRTPERYMAAADVFCLPSYGEGFASVVIQAAAVGLPVIASRVLGVADTVLDDITGILHEPKNVDQIVHAMRRLSSDPALRDRMGQQAARRARQDFSSERLTKALLEYYEQHLGH